MIVNSTFYYNFKKLLPVNQFFSFFFNWFISLILQALKHGQERSLEELEERQQEEKEKLEDKLAREAKTTEQKEMQDFEAYRERALREAKNRQAAELSARSDLSAAETQQVCK